MPRTGQRVPATWVAEVAGSVVGFVVVIDDEVEQIYVAAPARGTGVAGMLLDRAEDVIAAAGHGVAWLAVVAGTSGPAASTPGTAGSIAARSRTRRRPRSAR